MNICIFPGTFNPIHTAHLKMAEIAVEKFGFDKIIFIPAYIPPHKNIQSNLAKHRYNMVKLAIKGNRKFDISDIEYQSEGKSYSLITVKKILEQYNLNPPLNFIIGTDAFVKLDSWYKSEELKSLVHFIVFQRKGDGCEKVYENFKKNGWNFEIVQNDYMNISSTDIRRGNAINQINPEVEEYIKTNELYG